MYSFSTGAYTFITSVTMMGDYTLWGSIFSGFGSVISSISIFLASTDSGAVFYTSFSFEF